MNTKTEAPKKATLSIEGMSCSGCANTVQQVLSNIEGVENAAVDLEGESATVIFNPNTVIQDDFQQVVDKAGYECKGIDIGS